MGIRLGDLVFMTDTAVDHKALPFMKDAELLPHEIWFRDEERSNDSNDSGHSHLSGVAELAAKAGVRRTMPIHLHPERRRADIEEFVARLEQGGLSVLPPAEGVLCEIPD
jgi:ribonuclease BN (tRNA processing enzyme)